MSWNEGLTKLQDILSDLYKTEELARQIVAKADLQDREIDYSDARATTWFYILEEADKQKKVADIVAVAVHEYPNHEVDLNQALVLYKDRARKAATLPGMVIVGSSNVWNNNRSMIIAGIGVAGIVIALFYCWISPTCPLGTPPPNTPPPVTVPPTVDDPDDTPLPVVEIPALAGLTVDEARRKLSDIELQVGRISEESSRTYAKDFIIRTDPQQGRQVRIGSAVNLVVSLGQSNISIPDLAGKDEADAIRLLQDACQPAPCFDIQNRYEESDTVEAGLVIDSRPAQGEEANPGSEVTLVVSTGSPSANVEVVPEVVGLTKNAAIRELEQTCEPVPCFDVSSEESHSSIDQGMVIDSRPSAGTAVERGSTVTLIVSMGPEVVGVPDLVEMAINQAKAALDAAGLVVGGVSEQYSDSIARDRVIESDPAAGKEVSKNSTVALVVSLGCSDRDNDDVCDISDAFPDDSSEWSDNDGDGLGDNADPDDDNDGMSDSWESRFEPQLDRTKSDAERDSDGDGVSNLEEYKAGTDPTDSGSRPLREPVAEFSASPLEDTAPCEVQFWHHATNAQSYLWDFGDGYTSTGKEPSHTYEEGVYTVQLTVTNSSGSDTETKEEFVTCSPKSLSCSDPVRTKPFSEEEGSMYCPADHVVVGISCIGPYCDNKELLCCPYDPGYGGGEYTRASPYISDNPDRNHPQYGSMVDEYMDSSAWVYGMECEGDFCDNIRLHFLETPRLINSGYCAATQEIYDVEISERRCPTGSYVAGIQCLYHYCERLILDCCKAE